ncbi:MAG: carbonic anhydrase family protein [Nitrospira sp.]|nr:carbonic anhydrase family protein [Nitrospira sp.]
MIESVKTFTVTAMVIAGALLTACTGVVQNIERTVARINLRAAAPHPEAPHWSYEGAEGPAFWGKLSPSFLPCAEGHSQSPIDIATTSPASLPTMSGRFRPAELKIVHHEHFADAINNGHTIQVNYTEGDTLTIGETSYELLQYHFHAPSEHTVQGIQFPMEMHFVHKSASGALAVVAVFIEQGRHNNAFDPVWAHLPTKKSVESHFEGVQVNVDALLPKSNTSYRYEGSLTTPPCSEGVKWIVMTTPIQLSTEQIGMFTALIKGNNRPVQPLNKRMTVTDRLVEEAR